MVKKMSERSRWFTSLLMLLLLFAASGAILEIQAQPSSGPERFTCFNRNSRCFLRTMTCPPECPTMGPRNSNNPRATKVCFANCESPMCRAECKHRKPNCNGRGAACYDPRFVGGDGAVFYFHGRRNEHFSLVSDRNLQINARFIGLRPAGRTRDYTWIQALGILFGTENNTTLFSLEATKATSWDDNIDHLKFSYNGNEVLLPEDSLFRWASAGEEIRVERISSKNSVKVSVGDVAEIKVNVVPVTKEDDRVHKYQIPSNDCFAHLEVQFTFFGLTSEVEGVLGRTYRLDYENPAKPGLAMPVVGGEDKYKTTSLLSADCNSCNLFSLTSGESQIHPVTMQSDKLDCTAGGGLSSGNVIVCKK